METPLENIDEMVPNTIDSNPDDVQLQNLIDLLESKLDERQIKAVKQIGYSIQRTGIRLEEALLLARVGREEFDTWCKYVPEVKTYIKLKQLEYKYDLLAVINDKVKDNADTKLATWLLEKNFSEEYDSSYKREIAKQNRNADDDVLAMVMTFVRKNQSHRSPIEITNGDPLPDTKDGKKVYDVKDILK